MKLHNTHVVSFHTSLRITLTLLTLLAGVSCNGCVPADNADAGPGADGGLAPTPTLIALNEAMSRNSATLQDDIGEFDDWLELFNLTDEAVDLAGFTLADSGGAPVEFPAGATVPANGFLVVFLDDAVEQGSITEPHFPFKLAGEGDTLTLFDDGEAVDIMTIPTLELDESFGRQVDGEGDAVKLGSPTPGASNALVQGESEAEGENCAPTILLNEVLAENQTGYTDAAGDRDPWLELYNAGLGDADLAGLRIVVGGASAELAPRIVPSDGYVVVVLDNELGEGSAATEPHVGVVIDGSTAAVSLRDACGDTLQTFELTLAGPDVSVGFAPGAEPTEDPVALTPTPGEANAL